MSRQSPIKVDDETLARQAIASDPDNTVWVSANAGSGKTHVLSQRVVRLLLDGVPPSRILCLTYTKRQRRRWKTACSSGFLPGRRWTTRH